MCSLFDEAGDWHSNAQASYLPVSAEVAQSASRPLYREPFRLSIFSNLSVALCCIDGKTAE